MSNKKNIYLMYAIALLQGMVFYGPIATLYRQANGLTVFQITLIESISYILCVLLEVPWGMAADRIGYRKTMCFCCGLYFVSKLVFWGAGGFGGFLLERVMLSVVIAGLSGVDTSILYLSCRPGESQRVFGIYNSLSMAGLLLASFVFSAFVRENYSAAALLTAVSYGLAFVLSLFLTEVKGGGRHRACFPEFRDVFLRIVKNKRLVLFLVAAAFVTQTHQTVTVFLNQLQYKKCGLSDAAIGYIYIGITLAGALGIFSQRLTQKAGVKRMGTALHILAAAACAALGFTDSAWVSVLGILSLNVMNAFYQPYQMELQNRQVLSENRATELSVYAMMIDGIRAGSSLLFGALARAALESAFFFGGGICLAGLLLFHIWYKQTKRAGHL